jgi:hypothetical protein
MSAALGRVGALDTFVQDFDWTVLDAMRRLSDHRQSVAAAVLKRASEAIAADEHVQPLEPALKAERSTGNSSAAHIASSTLRRAGVLISCSKCGCPG